VALVPVMTWLVTRLWIARMTRNWQELVPPRGRFQRTRIEDAIGGMRVVKAFANEGP
jgi:ATP-binding cassette subfamily B protein